MFYLQTDNISLLSTYDSGKQGKPTHTANILQRRGTILLNCDYKIGYFRYKNKKLEYTDGLYKHCEQPECNFKSRRRNNKKLVMWNVVH